MSEKKQANGGSDYAAVITAEQQQFLRDMHEIILTKTSAVLLPIWHFLVLMWIQLIGGKANHPSTYAAAEPAKRETKKRGPKKKQTKEETVEQEEEEQTDVKREEEDVVEIKNGMDIM